MKRKQPQQLLLFLLLLLLAVTVVVSGGGDCSKKVNEKMDRLIYPYQQSQKISFAFMGQATWENGNARMSAVQSTCPFRLAFVNECEAHEFCVALNAFQVPFKCVLYVVAF